MVDLLGPGDAGALRTLTTTTDVSNPNPADTFFGDCVNGVAGTGTPIVSKWLNRQLQQIRRVIRASQIALVNNTDDDMLGQAIQSGALTYAAAGGPVNAYTASLTPVPLALQDGLEVNIYFGTANTSTTPTLALNTLAPATVTKQTGAALVAGDLSGPISLISKAGNWMINGLARSDVPSTQPGAVPFPGLPANGLLPSSIAGSSTTASMTIGTGGCSNNLGTQSILSTTPLSWAVANGNAANGNQGGATLSASTTYFMHLIWGTAGIACFASTSLTAPALPSGYQFFRMIFPFITDGSGNPIPWTSYEGQGGSVICSLATVLVDVNGVTVPTSARSLYTLTVPIGVQVETRLKAFIAENGSPLGAIIFTSGGDPDVAPSNGVPTIGDGVASTGGSFAFYSRGPLVTNTSGQVGMRCSNTSGQPFTASLYNAGWIYYRRT